MLRPRKYPEHNRDYDGSADTDPPKTALGSPGIRHNHDLQRALGPDAKDHPRPPWSRILEWTGRYGHGHRYRHASMEDAPEVTDASEVTTVSDAYNGGRG